MQVKMRAVPCYDVVERRNILDERVLSDIKGWCIEWKRSKFSKTYYFVTSLASRKNDDYKATECIILLDTKPIYNLYNTKEEAEEAIQLCMSEPDRFIIV